MELFGTSDNPVPEGAVVAPVVTADGVTLRAATWPATTRKKLGTVCLMQGRAEFIEKYFEVIEDLRKRGFAVATFDWRGQGGSQRLLSDPFKGHVDDFELYDRDLKAIIKQIVLPDCPPPYYALAHSTGGQIALRFARDRSLFDRMVLSAPLLGIHLLAGLKPWARALVTTLDTIGFGGHYVFGGGATSISMLPFEGNVLTSDRERYARTKRIIEAHPGLAIGSPTISWVHAAFRATDGTAEVDFGPKVMVPILIIACGADTVVSNAEIERLSGELRVGTHLMVPASRHEILMERDLFREQFWAAFDAFVPGSGRAV